MTRQTLSCCIIIRSCLPRCSHCCLWIFCLTIFVSLSIAVFFLPCSFSLILPYSKHIYCLLFHDFTVPYYLWQISVIECNLTSRRKSHNNVAHSSRIFHPASWVEMIQTWAQGYTNWPQCVLSCSCKIVDMFFEFA